MSTSIALDLKTARRKSGLTIEDCAHLLDISKSTVSRFETGKLMPNLHHLATLSLVYGKEMQNLAQGLFYEIRPLLPERLSHMPDVSDGWCLDFLRTNTLNRIEARLQSLNNLDHGSA